MVRTIWSLNHMTITTPSPLHMFKNSTPSPSSYFIYKNSIHFHENNLFMTLFKMVASEAWKENHPFQGLKRFTHRPWSKNNYTPIIPLPPPHCLQPPQLLNSHRSLLHIYFHMLISHIFILLTTNFQCRGLGWGTGWVGSCLMHNIIFFRYYTIGGRCLYLEG